MSAKATAGVALNVESVERERKRACVSRISISLLTGAAPAAGALAVSNGWRGRPLDAMGAASGALEGVQSPDDRAIVTGLLDTSSVSF